MLNFWKFLFFPPLYGKWSRSQNNLASGSPTIFFSFLWNAGGTCSGIDGYCSRSSSAVIHHDALDQSSWKTFSAVVFHVDNQFQHLIDHCGFWHASRNLCKKKTVTNRVAYAQLRMQLHVQNGHDRWRERKFETFIISFFVGRTCNKSHFVVQVASAYLFQGNQFPRFFY